MLKKLKIKIKEKRFPLLIELIKWKLIDVRRYIKDKDKPVHLFGIWLVCGLYGMGKTMYLTYYLEEQRKKYGDKIYISTNYYYKGQDFPITHWKDLLKEYDKPVLFAYDEIQNEFNSRDYKNFPMELLTLLTQNRKGNGKQIIGTAQRYTRVDKVFRELCSHIVECKTRFGRMTSVKAYDWEDYEMFLKQVDVNKRMKIHPKWRKIFVQSDYIRTRYDSYQMLESAKGKEYVSREERVLAQQLL